MKHWCLACACALSVAAASATAGDHVPFTMIGSGGLSCAKFIEYQKPPNNKAQMDALVQWVWGFISAYNARGFFDATVQREVNQVSPPDESTVLSFMGQFCARAPAGYLVSGTLALIRDLGGAVAGRPDEIK
jgi:hypothetical protein